MLIPELGIDAEHVGSSLPVHAFVVSADGGSSYWKYSTPTYDLVRCLSEGRQELSYRDAGILDLPISW